MLEKCSALVSMAEEAFLGLYVMHPGAVFIMRIREGTLEVSRGKAAKGFIEDCERIVADVDLHRGTIVGILRGRTTFLKFSPNIPKRYRQRFRNALHGQA
jgi:hypothetical protein